MWLLAGSPTALDQKAHEGALERGTTVGVLGHGLDFHYPKSTLLLRKRIEEKGFVITWYKPDKGLERHSLEKKLANSRSKRLYRSCGSACKEWSFDYCKFCSADG